MKTKIAILALVPLLLCGCFTRSAVSALGKLKDDNATVNIGYKGIYGKVQITRTNPGTNQTAVVTEDGTVIVGDKVSYQKNP